VRARVGGEKGEGLGRERVQAAILG
jgi:hypothetical protein